MRIRKHTIGMLAAAAFGVLLAVPTATPAAALPVQDPCPSVLDATDMGLTGQYGPAFNAPGVYTFSPTDHYWSLVQMADYSDSGVTNVLYSGCDALGSGVQTSRSGAWVALDNNLGRLPLGTTFKAVQSHPNHYYDVELVLGYAALDTEQPTADQTISDQSIPPWGADIRDVWLTPDFAYHLHFKASPGVRLYVLRSTANPDTWVRTAAQSIASVTAPGDPCCGPPVPVNLTVRVPADCWCAVVVEPPHGGSWVTTVRITKTPLP